MIQPEPQVTWSLHATRIFKTVMLKSAVYFSVQTVQMIKHTDPMFTSMLRVWQEYMCAVNTDIGLDVHEMPLGWSSFDTHEAVCVFQGNSMMIPKFQAVSTVSPGYSSRDSRFKVEVQFKNRSS